MIEKKRKSGGTLPCGRPRDQSGRWVSDQWQGKLKAHLKKNQLKVSDQRFKIAKEIVETAGHFSAQEIVRRVLKTYPDIGPATVYRNIKVLCEAEILRETLVDASGRIVYEPYGEGHHDHIVCLDCSEIFEFHDQKIEALQSEIADRMKFAEIRHRHVLFAHCLYR